MVQSSTMPTRCPPKARRSILSTFSKLCQRELGTDPQSGHPCAVHLVWQLSGERLGNALAGIERVVHEAAAQGVRDLTLGDLASRMGAGR